MFQTVGQVLLCDTSQCLLHDILQRLLYDLLQCLQLWLRLGVMAYFLLCMGLLWLVRTGSCAASQFVDTGVMPMHVRLRLRFQHANSAQCKTQLVSAQNHMVILTAPKATKSPSHR